MIYIPQKFCMSALAIMTMLTPQDRVQPQQTYLARPSYLATGDAAAGRKAYLTLKCNTCHTVAGEQLGAKPPLLPGPQLGKVQALQAPEQIADSIAAPSHAISDKPGPWHGPAGSNMGDYTRVMTVRQLIDLVAYLRSL